MTESKAVIQQRVSNAVWNDEGGSERFEGSKKARLLVQAKAAVVRHLEAKEFPTRDESDALLVNPGLLVPDDLAESHPVVATHREMMNLGVLSHEMVDVPKASTKRNASHGSIFDIPEIVLFLRLNEPAGGVTS